MDVERWKRVDELLQSALRLPPGQQGDFLRQACVGDGALQQEVQSLLSAHGKLDDFLEAPALADAVLSANAPASPLSETLNGQTIAHYRVLHRLGSGGMGVVYEAEDLRLGRHVALKLLLESHATQSKSLVRFQQEARAISTLNHPHICTVYEVEEYDGKPVIVMELLEGETLMDRLRRGRLPLPQVRQWGMEVADALEAAHAAGLIHRDIKPANVFITPRGAIKVLDFGLAKLTAAPDSSSSNEESLTSMGVIAGTCAYMSPEQIRGDDLDGRTDVFSLGVMMYEMVTGERAFAQKNSALTMDAVLHKQPVSPSELNPDVPPELEEIINQAMEKDRDQRCPSAAELRADLERLAHESGSGSAGVFRSPATGPGARAPAGAVARRSSAAKRRTWFFGGGLVLILAVAAGIFTAIKLRRGTQPVADHAVVKPRRSIAVLGFRNLSHSPDQEWVSTALSEMLDTELASGNELRVVSGENVAHMKLDLSLPATDTYAPQTLAKIRTNLAADEVVVGSYLVVGKGEKEPLRIDLRVQDAQSGETIAAVSENGSEGELADLVSRVSSTLRGKLGIGLVPEDELHRAGTSLPANPQAVRLYSEGLARLRAFDALAARDLFQKAVAADPGHALSHSFLARSLFNLGYEQKAKAEAGKAFELSQNLPRRDRLLVEGNYRELQHDYPAAMEAYRTLWEFFPDDVDAGLRLASVQILAGKSKDALVTVDQIRKLPGPSGHDPRIDLEEAIASGALGDFQRAQKSAALAAEAAARQGSRLVMTEAKRNEAWYWERLGQMDRATAEFAEVKDESLKTGNPISAASALNGIGAAYYDKGDFENSRKAYEEGLAIVRRVGAIQRVAVLTSNLGNIFFERGKMEEARRHYQEALDIDRALASPAVASDLGSLANVMDSMGDLAGAVQMQEQSLAGFRSAGDRRGEGATLVNLADVLREQGRFADSMARYQDAIAVDQQSGFRRDLGFAWSGISEILRYQDHLPEARAKTEDAIALRKELGDVTDLAYSQIQLAQISLEQGNIPEAAQFTQEAAAAFAKQNMFDAGCLAHAIMSQAQLAQNKIPEAQQAATQAADLCRQGSDRGARFRTQFAKAAVRGRLGDYAEAFKILEGVRSESSRFGYAAFDFESRLRLGELELKSGKRAAGRARLAGLQTDAQARGFSLFTRKAAQDLQSH